MYKEQVFKIPIYFGDLKVIVTNDLQKVGDKYEIGDMNHFDAVVFDRERNGYLIICMAFKSDVKLSAVCHETVHAVNRIFHYRGIKPDLLNDEPQAYLSGWVFDTCYKFLNKELNAQQQ